ncbi:unnamed protein product [Amoebophrya sp. A25]|nr:unnamed protein product [Amoebophrya sp. A25]|eukprot:GSA25T00025965001.1
MSRSSWLPLTWRKRTQPQPKETSTSRTPVQDRTATKPDRLNSGKPQEKDTSSSRRLQEKDTSSSRRPQQEDTPSSRRPQQRPQNETTSDVKRADESWSYTWTLVSQERNGESTVLKLFVEQELEGNEREPSQILGLKFTFFLEKGGANVEETKLLTLDQLFSLPEERGRATAQKDHSLEQGAAVLFKANLPAFLSAACPYSQVDSESSSLPLQVGIRVKMADNMEGSYTHISAPTPRLDASTLVLDTPTVLEQKAGTGKADDDHSKPCLGSSQTKTGCSTHDVSNASAVVFENVKLQFDLELLNNTEAGSGCGRMLSHCENEDDSSLSSTSKMTSAALAKIFSPDPDTRITGTNHIQGHRIVCLEQQTRCLHFSPKDLLVLQQNADLAKFTKNGSTRRVAASSTKLLLRRWKQQAEKMIRCGGWGRTGQKESSCSPSKLWHMTHQVCEISVVECAVSRKGKGKGGDVLACLPPPHATAFECTLEDEDGETVRDSTSISTHGPPTSCESDEGDHVLSTCTEFKEDTSSTFLEVEGNDVVTPFCDVNTSKNDLTQEEHQLPLRMRLDREIARADRLLRELDEHIDDCELSGILLSARGSERSSAVSSFEGRRRSRLGTAALESAAVLLKTHTTTSKNTSSNKQAGDLEVDHRRAAVSSSCTGRTQEVASNSKTEGTLSGSYGRFLVPPLKLLQGPRGTSGAVGQSKQDLSCDSGRMVTSTRSGGSSMRSSRGGTSSSSLASPSERSCQTNTRSLFTPEEEHEALLSSARGRLGGTTSTCHFPGLQGADVLFCDSSSTTSCTFEDEQDLQGHGDMSSQQEQNRMALDHDDDNLQEEIEQLDVENLSRRTRVLSLASDF